MEKLLVENEEKKDKFVKGGNTVKLLKRHIARETNLTVPTITKHVDEIISIIKHVSKETEYELN